jgi:hypothetical protein
MTTFLAFTADGGQIGRLRWFNSRRPAAWGRTFSYPWWPGSPSTPMRLGLVVDRPLRWVWHRRGWNMRKICGTSAWAYWWVGIDLGWAGLGVVRETWGWPIMLGPWHLTGIYEDEFGHG